MNEWMDGLTLKWMNDGWMDGYIFSFLWAPVGRRTKKVFTIIIIIIVIIIETKVRSSSYYYRKHT